MQLLLLSIIFYVLNGPRPLLLATSINSHFDTRQLLYCYEVGQLRARLACDVSTCAWNPCLCHLVLVCLKAWGWDAKLGEHFALHLYRCICYAKNYQLLDR